MTFLLGKLLVWDGESWNPTYYNWNKLSVYPRWIADTVEHLRVLMRYKYKAVYHTGCKSLICRCTFEK